MHIEAYYLRQWSVPAPDARGHPARPRPPRRWSV